MRKVLAIVAAFCVAACSPGPDPAESARADAAAAAEANRLSTPPAIPVSPQPITFADIEKHDLFGAGCYFLDGTGERAAMLFLASEDKGWMKLDGKMIEFSANRASMRMPYMTWSEYVGLAQVVRLTRNDAQERASGEETVTAPGTIRVVDGKDRELFSRNGAVECGA